MRSPFPGSPRRFARGTSVSSNESSASGVARLPILSSARASTRDSARETMKAVGPASRTRAMTTPVSAMVPLVIMVIVPRSRYASPAGSAAHSTLAASEPTLGSVRPKNPIDVPRTSAGRWRRRCASLPNSAMIAATMLWVVTELRSDPQQYASSSTSTRYEVRSSPCPPAASGTVAPTNPGSTSLAWRPSGRTPRRSCSATSGATSRSRKRRALSRRSFCSSVSSKSIGRAVLDAMRRTAQGRLAPPVGAGKNRAMERVEFTRDCEAVQIPSGEAVTIERDTEAYLTQSLGGSYTLQVPSLGGLFRISGRNGDAIGKEPLAAPEAVAEGDLEQQVWSALRTCYDPEIPVNIVDLGLVYDMALEPGEQGSMVNVKMTLTAPGCGMGTAIAADARLKLLELPGVADASVDIVWDPPWTPQMISPAGRERLGMA